MRSTGVSNLDTPVAEGYGGDVKEQWASKGGRARAAKMSSEERSAVARKAALARWQGHRVPAVVPGVPEATHMGELQIAGTTLVAAVLRDKTRVLTQETFLQAIGRAAKAKGGTGGLVGVPPFLSASNLQPYVTEELQRNAQPIPFKIPGGSRAWGYRAELLPEVCEAYLQARDDGALSPGQAHIVRACDVLMRGLARVGIVALVDEATGYAGDREAKDLQLLLDAYVGEEFRPYTKQFPEEFFREIYRLYDWQWGGRHRPQYLGKLINQLVYEQLPPGVLAALRSKNPRSEDTGHRPRRFHQLLSADVGQPHLDRQVSTVLTLMKASSDKEDFWDNFKRFTERKGVIVDVDPGR